MLPAEPSALERLRQCFEVHDDVSSAVPGATLQGTSWRDRYAAWRRHLPKELRAPREQLLPHIGRTIDRQMPSFTDEPTGHAHLDEAGLAAHVAALGPWHVSLPLRGGLDTVGDPMAAGIMRAKYLFRRDLIAGTIADLLGDDLASAEVLDIGCNCGFFSLDLAARGAASVHGVDLRAQNIAQARFLAEHYGITNVTFEVSDAEAIDPGRRADIVLNLGLLYHVTDPFRLLRETFERCRRVAVIDTVCTLEPVAGFILVGDRDTDRPIEGRSHVELHPTYRGAIEMIHAAGFTEVIEIVGSSDRPHQAYATGTRRCFLAFP